jgi:hypothetical protein
MTPDSPPRTGHTDPVVETMTKSRRIVFGCLLTMAAFLVGTSAPVAAMDRSEGDFWTYDMAMSVEEVDVSGEMTISFEGYDTINVNGTSYEVSVLKIISNYSGSMDILGSPMVVLGSIVGTIYETRDGYGTVKEDVTMDVNVTYGENPFQIVIREEMETTTTYSPPHGAGLDPTEDGPGDSWDEILTAVTTVYTDGVLDESSTEVQTYQYSIASSRESVTVPAGTFDALKMTVTDEDGGREVMWYSEVAGDAVKMEYYSEDSSEPYTTLELNEYSHDTGGLSTVILVFAGVGIALAVLALVVLLLVMKRRSGPSQVPPPMPEMPPPSPPQQSPPAPPNP